MNKIDVLILTHNEEENLNNTINYLILFPSIIIIDSNSTDRTLKIVQSYKQVKIYQRQFDNHANQWNYGISKCNNKWILSLDADYIVTDKLLEEINSLNLDTTSFVAFHISFKYCVNGIPLKSAILPPRLALFNKEACRYEQDGHTQDLKVKGPVGKLKNPLLHDDRKPLDRWINSQIKYVDLELDKLLNENNILTRVDKIRKYKFIAPFLIFFYCYFYKFGFLDGKRGLFYALQRTFAELLLSLKLIEHSFTKTKIYEDVNQIH